MKRWDPQWWAGLTRPEILHLAHLRRVREAYCSGCLHSKNSTPGNLCESCEQRYQELLAKADAAIEARDD